MQRATRNTFYQKGAEVQKIDQHGVWAIIESSYLNPEYERICLEGDTPESEDTIISVARWVYKCRRLLRKHGHIVVILDNGETFEPCYFIEPSIHTRFENGTLVWLEPLPQLNGYLLFPGGLPECGGSEYYLYSYGSGSASGSGSDLASGYYGSGSGSGSGSTSGPLGSDSGYYGSVSGSGADYGSGTSGVIGTGGTGAIDCSALLNCLCVKKDSQGRVIGVYIKNPDGSLTEIMECGSGSGGSGGSGLENCCPPGDVPYVIEYNITVNGQEYSGVTGEEYWSSSQYGNVTVTHPNSDCDPPYLFLNFLAGCIDGVGAGVSLWIRCGFDLICYLATPDDIDITITGCPGLPTFEFTIKPGRCASGSFILRPASGAGGGGGNNGGGGNPGGGGGNSGGGNQACCPPEGEAYVMDYDITLYGTQFSGTTGLNIWHFWGIGWMIGMGGQGCYLLTQATCDNGNVSFTASYMCPGQNCIAEPEDFDYTITGCPGNPTINITVKPGHPCLSGSFILRPAQQ